jgi:hypothetical protein
MGYASRMGEEVGLDERRGGMRDGVGADHCIIKPPLLNNAKRMRDYEDDYELTTTYWRLCG